MKAFLSCLYFILSFSILAQDTINHVNGYKLMGEVRMLTPREGHEEVLFVTGDNKRRIPAFEIKSIKKDSTIYATVKHGEIYKLMKEIEVGYLSLYSFRVIGSPQFGPEYIRKVTGIGREVPNWYFKKSMSKFLSECPEITEKLENKTFNKGNLDELTRYYNTNCLKASETDQDTLSSELNLLITTVIRSNPDLEELILDIRRKYHSDQKIPEYMMNALRNNESSEINELIKLIKEKEAQ